MTDDKIPFKVSTSLKTIIGKELVTNANIAIFELVKNSYDAGAHHSWIIFKGVKGGEDPSIFILDDGSGMSKEGLVQKWLFVGYSEKKVEETEEQVEERNPKHKEHRVFAGAKGIGRFSCDTLGESLVLHTKMASNSTIHRLDIDWTRFEKDQKEEFQNMRASYSAEDNTSVEGYDLSKMGSGTILEITHLRNSWDVNDLRKLKRYLQRLVNPIVGPAAQRFIIEVSAREFEEDDLRAKADPSFGPIINGPVENFVFEDLGIKTTYIHSNLENGTITTRLVDKESLIFEMREESTYQNLNNIEVKIFFLNQAAKNTFTRTMGIPTKDFGSVFLYKNQFRIHPYGDEGDDWLGLEERKGQGHFRFLSKREIIGSVVLKDTQPLFKEVSSRDSGLIRNKAFFELTEYITTKVLRRLERYVTGVIDWDRAVFVGSADRRAIEARSLELVSKLVEGTKGPETKIKVGPNILQTLDRKFVETYPEILENLESLKEHAKGEKQRDLIDGVIRTAKKTLARVERDRTKLTTSLAAKQQENLFLKQQLTPEKEEAINNIHHIAIYAENMYPRLMSIQEWAVKEQAPQSVLSLIADSGLEIQKILALSKMAMRTSFDLRNEETEKDVVNFVRQYLESFRPTKDVIKRIQFQNDDVEFPTTFDPVLLPVVLDNLLDNSRKNGANQVTINFGVSGKTLHVLFADNGSGIDNNVKDHLFEAGYSNSGGSGWGLYQIKKIMREKLRGDINFVGNNKQDGDSGACFEMTFH